MNVESVLPWVMTALLLSVRLGVAVAMTPAMSAYGVPSLARWLLVFGLAGLACSRLAPSGDVLAWMGQPLRLLGAVAAEVLIGVLLGLGVHVVLAAFALAGRLMDVQIGFVIGSVFDPVSRASSNAMGALMSVLGVTLFFTSDAHIELARMVAMSTTLLPLGQLPDLAEPLRPALAAGSLFTLGLALAAPVALALVLTDLVVGVAARNLPQVNVLILSVPVKVMVGYFVLALSVVGWSPLVRRAFAMVGDIVGARR